MTTATTSLTQAPAAPILVGVPMMDEQEARDAIDRMRGDLEQVDVSLNSFRQRSLDFKEREGWRALGYSGYIAAIRTELGSQYSKSYLSRLLKAAEIERVLELPTGNAVPERTLRPLGDLDTPDQRRTAWERAAELAGDKQPTTKHVERAVKEAKPPTGAISRPAADLAPPELTPEQAQQAAIREQAAALGLLIAWEEGGVMLYWPDEVDDLEQMDVLSYEVALEWLEGDALGIAAGRAEPTTTTTTAAARPCAECGAPSTTRENIGGLREPRCDGCTIRALVGALADTVPSEPAAAGAFLDSQVWAMRTWDNSALPSRREYEAALAYLAALLRMIEQEGEGR